MVETVGEVLQRPCLGYFSTVHVDGEVISHSYVFGYISFEYCLGKLKTEQ
jgi:hypothetical protein